MASYAESTEIKKSGGMMKSIKTFFGAGSGKKVNLTIKPASQVAKEVADSLQPSADLQSPSALSGQDGHPKKVEVEEMAEENGSQGSPMPTSSDEEEMSEKENDEDENEYEEGEDESDFKDAEEGCLFDRMIVLSNKFEITQKRFLVKILVKYLLDVIAKEGITYNIENRLISEERLKHFKNFDVSHSDPIILGRQITTSTYDIIDGQHRIEFLKRNFDKYANEMILIDIRLYEEEKEYYRILDVINDRFNFDHSQLRRFKYMECKDLLIAYVRKRKCVAFGERRPYLQEEKFQQALFKTAIFNKVETKGTDVFAKMLEVNHFLSTAIVGIDEKTISAKMKMSFDKMGLYLALDKSYASIQLLDVSKEKFAETWKSLRKTW